MAEVKVGQKWKSTDWWIVGASGKTVEITAVEGETVYYAPSLFSGDSSFDDLGLDTWEERWELEENKFKVGDRVRTINSSDFWSAGEEEELRSVSSTGAEKGVKLSRFSLLPMEALTEVATHYGVGASKYDEHNMRRGYEWSKSFDALMRHATQFWSGEDRDAETGSKHLSAVVFHALTLMEFMESHPEFDDRYKL